MNLITKQLQKRSKHMQHKLLKLKGTNEREFVRGQDIAMSLKEYSELPFKITKNKFDNEGYLFGEAANNYRKDTNMVNRADFPVDLDNVPHDIFDELVQGLKAQGVNAVVHTSFSHKLEGKGNRFRVIAETNRTMTPDEFPNAVLNFIDDVQVLKKYKEYIDPCTDRKSQFFLAPSHPPGMEKFARKQYINGGAPYVPDTQKRSATNSSSSKSDVVQRNVTLTKEVGRLVQLYKHKPTVIRGALAFNETYDTPLEIKEVMTVVNSIWRKHFKDNPEDIPIKEITSGRQSYKLSELKNLPKVDWLVDGVLANKGIATIYGASGSSKSFVAIDLAMNLALGNAWFGIPVITKVPVVYVALEGFTGVVKRLQGWCKHYKWYPNNLEVTRDELLLAENKSVDDFISFYRGREFSGGIVIIDTLNNACPNIDENHAGAMSGVIYNLKRIQTELDCTVLIIHHSGKNEENGMRGSSSLKASMDSVLHVTQSSNGLCHWVLEKSKDSECGVGYSYRLDEIEINDETTCVIRVVGGHEPAFKKQSLGTNQGRVFELLKERILPTFSQDEDLETTISAVATKWTEQPSNKRSNLIRSNISKLIEYGLIGTGFREQNQDRIWITEKGMNQ